MIKMSLMKMQTVMLYALCVCVLSLGCASNASTQVPAEKPEHHFEIGDEHFLLDGQKIVLRCGEIHPTRVPKAYWRHRLQMCKAMGLNTVSVYVFWNYHERTPGEFTWEGRGDLAEFIRIAQEEDLWVILRPGPYVCSEWEMGGLPWWLLKHEGIELRTRDPRFMEPVKRYMKAVGEHLGELQVTRGGPILMVQVENEYGYYSNDAEYMGELKQIFEDAGFDVPLFGCNQAWSLRNGHRDDLFPVVNFGSNPADAFRQLRELRKDGPLMCGEFYPGWFDTWGREHHIGDLDRYIADIEFMLENDASFSIYMAHGGSSFGLWAGADAPFLPDTSSYDFDAPISEAGWTNEKYKRARALMRRFLLPGETMPEPPAMNPVMTVDPVTLTERAAVLDNLPEPKPSAEPQNYEALDQARGAVVYRTTVPAGPAGKLKVERVHDFGWVMLDGQEIGVFDRRNRRFELNVPARDKPAQLDVMVYTMGRVNFGKEIHDRKGLHGPVVLTDADGEKTLSDWQQYQLPMTRDMLDGLAYQQMSPGDVTTGAAFYRGTLNVEKAEDTFLDMTPWGKGIVWINGECLGRYWNIGPTQTMYVPGPWLKQGKNEIVVLDLLGPSSPVIATVKTPELNTLRPEMNFGKPQRADVTLTLADQTPVHAGEFEPGGQAQTVKFESPVAGRQFCLESLSAFGDQPFAAVAELVLIGADGKSIDTAGWSIAYVNSEEFLGEDGTAENAFDRRASQFWHTQWQNGSPDHPHRLVINLGQSETVTGFRYLPRPGQDNNIGGRIKGYRVYVGDDLVEPAL